MLEYEHRKHLEREIERIKKTLMTLQDQIKELQADDAKLVSAMSAVQAGVNDLQNQIQVLKTTAPADPAFATALADIEKTTAGLNAIFPPATPAPGL